MRPDWRVFRDSTPGGEDTMNVGTARAGSVPCPGRSPPHPDLFRQLLVWVAGKPLFQRFSTLSLRHNLVTNIGQLESFF